MMQSIPQSTTQSWRFDWIFGPVTDLLYFFLPVPFGLLLLWGSSAFEFSNVLLFALIGLEVTALGAFHQGATFFHFLDKTNQEHYFATRKGQFTFILMPLFLLFATIIGDYYLSAITFLIYACWALNHGVQQNIGILLLYQNGNTNEAKVPRSIQAWSQRWIAICCTLLFFQRTVMAGTALSEILYLPIACSVLIGLCYCVAYLANMLKQVVQGKHVNLSGFFFWLLCIVYLLPFAFLGKNFGDALMIPLVVHWCQYIGINYIVAQRKYQDEHCSQLPLKNSMLVYLISGFTFVIILVGLSFFRQMRGLESPEGRLLQGLILGLGMVHYYLDGFIWRFRDKFPRGSLLPHLIRR